MPENIRQEIRASLESRRDFMKATGLAMLGLTVAGCAAKTRHAAPLSRQPQDQRPGVPYWYTASCSGCTAGCGTVMKVRDGRPIKAEGNPAHPLSRGGLCARGQAALLSLYDPDRLRGPLIANTAASWDEVDDKVRVAVAAAPQGSVRLLTGTVNGPATRTAISQFLSRCPAAKHIMHDAVPMSAVADAHGRCFGVRAVPRVNLAAASTIVSFGADFLGTWLSPVEHARDWAQGRSLESAKTMSRHIQFEAAMTLTGAAADERHILADSERRATLVSIARRIAAELGDSDPYPTAPSSSASPAVVSSLVAELLRSRGSALLLCGGNDLDSQLATCHINHLLGAYGPILDLASPSQQKLGQPDAVAELLADMRSGTVSVLIMWGVNPAYDLPDGAGFADALKKIRTSVAISDRADETAALCGIIAPDHHPLETWSDGEPVRGLCTLSQPSIRPLYCTREAQLSLLAWTDKAAGVARPWREILRDHWQMHVLAGGSWESVLQAGFVDRRGPTKAFPLDAKARGSIGTTAAVPARDGDNAGFELSLSESLALGDGRHANNAWLQELPDSLTKCTWGNTLALSPAAMKRLNISDGDIVRVDATIDGRTVTVELPAVSQPGNHDRTASISLGYGRTRAGRLASAGGASIGVNAFPLVSRTGIAFASLTPTGTRQKLARTQEHDSQEHRPLAREVTFGTWLADPHAGNDDEPELPTMWPRREHKGHHWGMAVNLNACIGCAGCVVGCQAENNIPVVGADEVARRREMHWLRIDRYYANESDSPAGSGPAVAFQPMMCQHCENAPCENVCPVAATSHSEEGLNQQTYNRCVGTRYCANNCPVKVRRFNWFDYAHDDPTLNLVLNPDVTVRSRGIMEKCSMCVQRIYDAKLLAAREGRVPRDSELTTACQQSCPTSAIIFGDLNDPQNRVARARQDPRNYALLAELNIRPAVTYLTKVRNTGTGTGAAPAAK